LFFSVSKKGKMGNEDKFPRLNQYLRPVTPNRPRVFENRALTRIFRSKRVQVT
jgi:hypothetical protein